MTIGDPNKQTERRITGQQALVVVILVLLINAIFLVPFLQSIMGGGNGNEQPIENVEPTPTPQNTGTNGCFPDLLDCHYSI